VDIGAGSGSIGIEWMLADPSMRAIAIEADPVRAERARHNAAACERRACMSSKAQRRPR
jgi:precorrin-6Y C5,15-methyltransferase (decarboxylating)